MVPAYLLGCCNFNFNNIFNAFALVNILRSRLTDYQLERTSVIAVFGNVTLCCIIGNKWFSVLDVFVLS